MPDPSRSFRAFVPARDREWKSKRCPCATLRPSGRSPPCSHTPPPPPRVHRCDWWWRPRCAAHAAQGQMPGAPRADRRPHARSGAPAGPDPMDELSVWLCHSFCSRRADKAASFSVRQLTEWKANLQPEHPARAHGGHVGRPCPRSRASAKTWPRTPLRSPTSRPPEKQEGASNPRTGLLCSPPPQAPASLTLGFIRERKFCIKRRNQVYLNPGSESGG